MAFWLFVFGVLFGVYGLVEDRDIVVLAGALLAASAVAINRFAVRDH